MIEYLHSTIRATAGDSITITAKITDSAGAVIQETCSLCLYDGNTKLLEVAGTLDNTIWNFTIDGETTAALAGRYWYKVCDSNHNSLDFAQPIYFITRGKANSDFDNGRAFEQARLKPELKAAIEERGAVIPAEANVDEYAGYLRSCSYIVTGTWTPVEDTTLFTMENLAFEPTVVMVYWVDDTTMLTDKSSMIKYMLIKDGYGLVRLVKTGGKFSSSSVNYNDEAQAGESIISKELIKLDSSKMASATFRAGCEYCYVIY